MWKVNNKRDRLKLTPLVLSLFEQGNDKEEGVNLSENTHQCQNVLNPLFLTDFELKILFYFTFSMERI